MALYIRYFYWWCFNSCILYLVSITVWRHTLTPILLISHRWNSYKQEASKSVSLATITTFPMDFEAYSAILLSAPWWLQKNSCNWETPSSILHVCSNVVAWASAGGVINFISVLNHSSQYHLEVLIRLSPSHLWPTAHILDICH